MLIGLSQEAELDRFAKNAGEKLKLLPKLAVRIRLPKICKELQDLTFAIMSNRNHLALNELLVAANHVSKVVYGLIQVYPQSLLDTGLKSHNICVESCGYDEHAQAATREALVGSLTAIGENVFTRTLNSLTLVDTFDQSEAKARDLPMSKGVKEDKQYDEEGGGRADDYSEQDQGTRAESEEE